MRPPRRPRRPKVPSVLPTPPAGVETVAGVCWYRQDQYERLLACADDRDKLEDTWAEWQITAERAIRRYRSMGLDLRKVEIDLDDLLAYCRAEGCPNDDAARAAYVVHLLERQQDDR